MRPFRSPTEGLTGRQKRLARRERRRQVFRGLAHACSAAAQYTVQDRQSNRDRKRLDWDEHRAQLGPMWFQRIYRLDYGTFDHLCDLIRDKIAPNEARANAANARSGPVRAEIKLALALRFLAGASYCDLFWSYGVSVTTVFKSLHMVMDAIDERLQNITFPLDDVNALTSIATGFKTRVNNPLWGCVGSIDGLAIRIAKPKSMNARDFFNRKGFYSYNLQAMCDSHYRFTWGSIKCPGSAHDSFAYGMTDLADALTSGQLPEGFWIAGDDAYPCSNSLLTPWSGRGISVYKDAFNFFLSSSRVAIEQAFGMLVGRWGVLWRTMDIGHTSVPRLVLVLMKLHNLCIDRNQTTVRRFAPGDSPSMSGLQVQDAVVFTNTCDLEPKLHKRRRDLEKSPKRVALTKDLAFAGIFRPKRSQNTRARHVFQGRL